MGMVAFFNPVSSEALAELKVDPGKLEALLFPDEEDGDGDVEQGGSVDIDKAWHGIHYLLCKIAGDDESPLAAAVLGGREIGEDLGYGPPRLLEPEEVRAVSAALSVVSPKQLEDAFDPGAMSAADIYPDIWERDGKEALDYLTHYFPALVDFYRGAASRGDGAVLYLA